MAQTNKQTKKQTNNQTNLALVDILRIPHWDSLAIELDFILGLVLGGRLIPEIVFDAKSSQRSRWAHANSVSLDGLFI
jgi:hypothetical protein